MAVTLSDPWRLDKAQMDRFNQLMERTYFDSPLGLATRLWDCANYGRSRGELVAAWIREGEPEQ